MLIRLTRSILMGIYFTLWDIFDYIRTVCRYYYKPRFALTDMILHLIYPLTAADRICFSYLKDAPSDKTQIWYGETSLTGFQIMTRAAGLTHSDHLFELGCGRGRLVFWASAFIGCQCTGIDINPTFVKRAQKIQQWCKWKNVCFLESNFLDASLEDASVIYLYGSAFEPPSWPNILAALIKTRPGTRIITVSKSLAEWGDSTHFTCSQTLWIGFVWGKAPVYIQERVDQRPTKNQSPDIGSRPCRAGAP